MVGIMATMVTSFKKTYASMLQLLGMLYSVPLTPQQATVNPHLPWRLLDTHRQVGLSLLWGHFSFLLGPGVHKILFMPSKRWLYGGVMVTSSKRAYAIPWSTAPRASASAAVHC